MDKIIKHFKTILVHKLIVGHYCFKLGLYKQGLLHDNSKFGRTEFVESVKHFQGNRSPIAAEKEIKGYSYVWQHHQNKNKHHWQYWTDFHDGGAFGVKMPFNYVLEMVCDYIGAGKVYSKGNWNSTMPLTYYLKSEGTVILDKNTKKLFLDLLTLISKKGLDNGIKYIKKNKKILKLEYNK